MKKLETVLKKCIEPLRGDAELQEELEQELRSHLEAGVEHFERGGKTPDEAEDLAVQTFGDPETVGRELLDANRPRLKRRLRFRLAVKILFLPILALAAWFAIDTRSLAPLYALSEFSGGGIIQLLYVPSFLRNPPSGKAPVDPLNDMAVRPLEPESRAFYEKRKQEPLVRASYLLGVFEQETGWDQSRLAAEQREQLRRDLAEAKRMEPDNALYDYMDGWLLLRQALTVQSRPKYQSEITLLDREKLDRAMACFKMGLTKAHFITYTEPLLLQSLQLRGTPKDFGDLMNVIAVSAAARLPYLHAMRNQIQATIWYGKQLLAEGKYEEAAFFLNSYKKLARQMNDNAFSLIDELVIDAVGNIGAQALVEAALPADKAEAERQLEQIKTARQDFEKRRKQNDSNTSQLVTTHGGILTGMLVPAIGGELTKEELMPELKLSYNLMDLTALGIGIPVLALFILLHLFFLLLLQRKGARIIVLSRGDYLWFFAVGILLPLAIYWLVSRIDFIGGRDYSPQVAPWRWIAQYAWFFGGIPIWSAVVFLRRLRRSRHGKKIPHNQVLANVLPALVLTLFVLVLVQRPLLWMEQRYQVRQDRQFNYGDEVGPLGFTRIEAQTVRKMQETNREVYSELVGKPIKIQP